jgi:phosphoenolpyruvate-protein kinase (PTS system EI component)
MRLIKQTIDVGHENDVWTGICGEMAGNPLMAPLLIGLGIDELSVSPTVVPLFKNVIRSLKYSQAEDLARLALISESATEVLGLCRKLVEEKPRRNS